MQSQEETEAAGRNGATGRTETTRRNRTGGTKNRPVPVNLAAGTGRFLSFKKSGAARSNGSGAARSSGSGAARSSGSGAARSNGSSLRKKLAENTSRHVQNILTVVLHIGHGLKVLTVGGAEKGGQVAAQRLPAGLKFVKLL